MKAGNNIKTEEIFMCDVKKFKDIYEAINNLTSGDTIQLVLESKSEEEQEFFELIGNYLLQKKQRTAIAENAF